MNRLCILLSIACFTFCGLPQTTRQLLDAEFLGDIRPPIIESISPTDGATDQTDAVVITVAFNEKMDAGTINASSFLLSKSTGTVPGVVTYSANEQRAFFTPAERLSLETPHTVTLTTALKDAAGNNLKQAFSWNFTTEACPSPKGNRYVPDSAVLAMVQSGCTIYLGGEFTHVGIQTGGGVVLDKASAQLPVNTTHLPINGQVLDVKPDGSGGWYIGGSFTYIGNTPRKYLARINADGSITDWNPGIGSGTITYSRGAIRNHLCSWKFWPS